VSTALTRSTLFTVGHCFLPLSQRVCSVGSWERLRRRAVPSCPQGGTWGPVPLRADRMRSAAPAPTRPARSRPPRSPRGASPARSWTGWAYPPARAASPAGYATGHASTDEPCADPCRTAAPARLGAKRSSGSPGDTAVDPQASAMDRSCRWCTAGRCAVVHRAAMPPYGLGMRSQKMAPTADTHPS
jgi:hypothetical protein